jgi:hypothetical protein
MQPHPHACGFFFHLMKFISRLFRQRLGQVYLYANFEFLDLMLACCPTLSCAAFFASTSAFSLPGIPAWPGSQSIRRFGVCVRRLRFSMSARIVARTCCPDCLPGLSSALRAAWLSVDRTACKAVIVVFVHPNCEFDDD